MRIFNGRWVDECDSPLTPMHNKKFSGMVDRLRVFTEGKELTHNKIAILCSIFDTDDEHDSAMVKVMQMDKKTLRGLI
jgi:hypothetical protein